jgi:hypothetical protein
MNDLSRHQTEQQEGPDLAHPGRGPNIRFEREHRTFLPVNEFH